MGVRSKSLLRMFSRAGDSVMKLRTIIGRPKAIAANNGPLSACHRNSLKLTRHRPRIVCDLDEQI